MDRGACGCESCKNQLCVRRVPVFSTLDPAEMDRVAGLIIHKDFIKGELIIMEGSRPDNLIIINKGQVKVFRYTQKYGREHPRGIMIELPLSREGIANYIGVARETVSRKLSLLQDEGIIEMAGHKKMIILDKKQLLQSIQ